MEKTKAKDFGLEMLREFLLSMLAVVFSLFLMMLIIA